MDQFHKALMGADMDSRRSCSPTSRSSVQWSRRGLKILQAEVSLEVDVVAASQGVLGPQKGGLEGCVDRIALSEDRGMSRKADNRKVVTRLERQTEQSGV